MRGGFYPRARLKSHPRIYFGLQQRSVGGRRNFVEARYLQLYLHCSIQYDCNFIFLMLQKA